jgi:hypothetical protein
MHFFSQIFILILWIAAWLSLSLCARFVETAPCGLAPTERADWAAGRWPATTDAKPLPPVWDAQRTRWIGPAEPDYPDGFYDDIVEAVADLEGRDV